MNKLDREQLHEMERQLGGVYRGPPTDEARKVEARLRAEVAELQARVAAMQPHVPCVWCGLPISREWAASNHGCCSEKCVKANRDWETL